MIKENQPTLHDLVHSGDLASLEETLAAGADVEQLDKNGWTALMTASRYSHVEAVRVLLKYGANPNKTGTMGNPPLGLAEEYKIALLLLDAGAEVNARDGYGYTPLAGILSGLWSKDPQQAAELDKVIDLLLERGADPKIKNVTGLGPIDYARRNKHDKVFARLLSASGVSSEPSESGSQEKQTSLPAGGHGLWSRFIGLFRGGPDSLNLRNSPYEDLVAQVRNLRDQLDSWQYDQGENELRRLRAQAHELGREFYRRGGKSMMLKAYQDAAGTRAIEISWDGIGEWRG